MKRPGLEDLARDAHSCKRILRSPDFPISGQHTDDTLFRMKTASAEATKALAMKENLHIADPVERACGIKGPGNPNELEPFSPFLWPGSAADVVH